MKRKNTLRIIAVVSAALWAAGLFLLVFVQARAMTKKEEPERVQMPEAEITATEHSAMSEEAIQQWHRFCAVYSERVPLTADEQLALFETSEAYGIDYFLLLGLIQRETQFRNIVGDGGDSYGYCQVQPKWHKARMDKLGVSDLMDAESNFKVACDYLRELFDRYGEGELTDVLTAYNSGHGGESTYSDSVIAYQEAWAAVIAP